MAELEVVKHTKKIHQILKNERLTWWAKVKEFLIEIFIIVFAVTITIWFHDLSENRHKQHDVAEFLSGLKNDLERDIVELEADRKSYLKMKKAFAYINGVEFNDKPSADSVNYYSNWYYNEVGFVPNDGRFEGFKSSGKVGDILDKELQNDIMDLYQENIRMLVSSTGFFSERKGKLVDYLIKNLKQVSATSSNLTVIMATDEARNICRTLYFTDEIISRYDACISKSKKIIESIDKVQH